MLLLLTILVHSAAWITPSHSSVKFVAPLMGLTPNRR